MSTFRRLDLLRPSNAVWTLAALALLLTMVLQVLSVGEISARASKPKNVTLADVVHAVKGKFFESFDESVCDKDHPCPLSKYVAVQKQNVYQINQTVGPLHVRIHRIFQSYVRQSRIDKEVARETLSTMLKLDFQSFPVRPQVLEKFLENAALALMSYLEHEFMDNDAMLIFFKRGPAVDDGLYAYAVLRPPKFGDAPCLERGSALSNGGCKHKLHIPASLDAHWNGLYNHTLTSVLKVAFHMHAASLLLSVAERVQSVTPMVTKPLPKVYISFNSSQYDEDKIVQYMRVAAATSQTKALLRLADLTGVIIKRRLPADMLHGIFEAVFSYFPNFHDYKTQFYYASRGSNRMVSHNTAVSSALLTATRWYSLSASNYPNGTCESDDTVNGCIFRAIKERNNAFVFFTFTRYTIYECVPGYVADVFGSIRQFYLRERDAQPYKKAISDLTTHLLAQISAWETLREGQMLSYNEVVNAFITFDFDPSIKRVFKRHFQSLVSSISSIPDRAEQLRLLRFIQSTQLAINRKLEILSAHSHAAFGL